MKKLLLTTALVAFAGVAHAVTLNGITNNGYYDGVDGNFTTGNTTESESTNSANETTYDYQRTQLEVHDDHLSLTYTEESSTYADGGWGDQIGETSSTTSSLTVDKDGTSVVGGLDTDTLSVGDIDDVEEAINDIIEDTADAFGRAATEHGALEGRVQTIEDDNRYRDGIIGSTSNKASDNAEDIETINSTLDFIQDEIVGDLISSDDAAARGLTQQRELIEANRTAISTISTTPGEKGETGAAGATGARGATGAAGADGQDARININSAGQYVVSDSSGQSVTVATDEQVTLTKDELTALIQSVAATATASLAAESEARIEEIQAEAEARIEALTAAAEERLAIKTLAVSNTISIVALEDQWKTDPVIGKFELDALTGKTIKIEVKPGIFENKIARVEDIQTIADRVADNTSRIQDLENAVFNQKEAAEDSRVQKLISCLLYTSPSPRDRQKSRMPSSA